MNKILKNNISCLFLLGIVLTLASCRSLAPEYNYRKLARAGIILGFDINENDPHKLYLEAAEWIGTPYRSAGDSKRGTDCSGLSYQLYRRVYRTKLHRTAEQQRSEDCHKVRKSHLRPGDLVFFGKRKQASHVGIYLKDNRFIHASSSRGVIVSSLNEQYYQRNWLSGGRVSSADEE